MDAAMPEAPEAVEKSPLRSPMRGPLALFICANALVVAMGIFLRYASSYSTWLALLSAVAANI